MTAAAYGLGVGASVGLTFLIFTWWNAELTTPYMVGMLRGQGTRRSDRGGENRMRSFIIMSLGSGVWESLVGTRKLVQDPPYIIMHT